ncbi:hypothetical protein KFK09_015842 [Dendrobium nobile]|uniref:Uncharacterized protein n=2 Tax=Dendrobium nobile TaxID=94219 RepID=A0A8T3B749_DENNO|nr:hypothetical protein KFK09_015842 [Dendrobium nobile]
MERMGYCTKLLKIRVVGLYLLLHWVPTAYLCWFFDLDDDDLSSFGPFIVALDGLCLLAQATGCSFSGLVQIFN